MSCRLQILQGAPREKGTVEVSKRVGDASPCQLRFLSHGIRSREH